jgi:DNA-binding MarR family transcriptional regulator
MSNVRRNKAALAERAWQLMFDYLMYTRPGRDRSLESRGLTPNDARALSSLNRDEGCPIGALARAWGCDPSNATFIIRRLEQAGLAERRTTPGDRRVKLVALTARGEKVRNELLAEFHEPPPELLGLSFSDLEALARILKRLRPTDGPSSQDRPE